MPIEDFPTVENGGPRPLKLLDLDPDWSVVTTEQEMDDGGADYNLEADAPILRWHLDYNGLSETEAQILDDHRASAKGVALTFTFTHPRTGDAFTGVRYESYETDHVKVSIRSRKIGLIRRP